MAMYHLTVKNIGRNQGRSAVGSAAYRSAEKLYNRYDGVTYDFTRKTGVAHTEILLPENAPKEFANREVLWNAVESAEKRVDSRTAREVEIALPRELTLAEQIELVRSFVSVCFVKRGMCADISLHTGKRSDNPHAHILLTTREVTRGGFCRGKNRNWNLRDNVFLWREQWAKFQNRALERKGLSAKVNHLSYAMQGIGREPTKHLGHAASALNRRNVRTDRSDLNRIIEIRNKERELREHRRQQEQGRVR